MYRRTIFSTLLATILLMALANAAWAQPTEGLVGYWPLENEGTGTAVDHSGSGRDGTLINQALFVSDGLDGGAMYFDGADDRVEITGWTGILGGQARTISAWIKTTNPKTDMTIVECDAEVQKVYKLKKFMKVDPKFKGRDGTDFRPVFDYFNEGEGRRDKPELLVFFTDLEGPFPDKESIRTVWVRTSQGYCEEVPFGKLIIIPDDEKKKRRRRW